jgi:hypothetical protein
VFLICKNFCNSICFNIISEKYSVYEVKVSASTSVGEGENTTAQEFRTDEDSKLNCTCLMLRLIVLR